MIYLDHNASSPIKPLVLEVLKKALELVGNPSAVHQYGRVLRTKIENSRQIVAKSLNASDDYNVIFTSSATESNMSILHGCRGVKHVIVSAIEHPSVRKSRDDLIYSPVLTNGIICLKSLEENLRKYSVNAGDVLVSVMMVNNETGIIQPVKEIAELAHKYGALVHSDAVQAFGRVHIDMQELGVDALTLSGHKIGGPQGVGALIVSKKLDYSPYLCGGGQEKRMRAGTENAAGIIAFGKASEIAVADLSKPDNIFSMRKKLEDGLKEIYPETVIFGSNVDRTDNTCFFAVPNLDSQTLVIALDMEGIAVTAGTACSSGTSETSTVLAEMKVPTILQKSAIRVSLGWNNTQEDVDEFLRIWKHIYSRLSII